MKYGIGSVIEFKHRLCDADKDEDSTYVDRINSIMYYCDGSLGYWTEIYPELYNVTAEISEDRVVRCFDNIPFIIPDDLPVFPVTKGELISFKWDNGKRCYGIVLEQYMIIDGDKDYQWRICAGEEGQTENQYFLAQDEMEEYDLRIERVVK